LERKSEASANRSADERREERGERRKKRTSEALQEHLKAPVLLSELTVSSRRPLEVNPVVIERWTRQRNHLRSRHDVRPQLPIKYTRCRFRDVRLPRHEARPTKGDDGGEEIAVQPFSELRVEVAVRFFVGGFKDGESAAFDILSKVWMWGRKSEQQERKK
jgi:hypothetical protein